MNFLFGSRQKPPETIPKEKEFDIKYLRAQLQKQAEENQQLRDGYEDQRQTATCNKKLLGLFGSLESFYRRVHWERNDARRTALKTEHDYRVFKG